MADSSTSRSRQSDSVRDSVDTGSHGERKRLLERTVPGIAASIRKAGFWSAIFLPICYTPMLLYGLSTGIHTLLFLFLLGLNLVALYVGHEYRR
ncbi:hypothetical protein G6M89_08865 [Natronolimnobius sp. AArcel1]|uniref:hypothetical protein n=1 Tax=Natronolimnobius sp. AArcel1 TaxID=1679093 RepID=UPI0013ECFB8F|nr:hypothetical protein [Natronolimnobius sp. AArcel1]NGM69116.1 hypothetical protein [Natronolimnobius sp. AArcel1]